MKKLSRKDLEIRAELSYQKYTILRRAICYGNGKIGEEQRNYGDDELRQLCYSLEGKNAKQLTGIHKQWIGY